MAGSQDLRVCYIVGKVGSEERDVLLVVGFQVGATVILDDSSDCLDSATEHFQLFEVACLPSFELS